MTAAESNRTFLLSALSCVGLAAAVCACDEGKTKPWSCEGDYVWADPVSGLCWTARKVNDAEGDDLMIWEEALAACDGLTRDGYTDWRLPKVQELIGLVRGCPSGDCPVHDPDCLDVSCNDPPVCTGCAYKEGGGVNGCYWPSELGDCGPIWSSSTMDSFASLVWIVEFHAGRIRALNGLTSTAYLRCVRGEASGTDADADADTDSDADSDADGDTDPGVVCDTDCPDLEWVEIPGGTFQMGSDDGDPNEQPLHGVTVPSFEMLETEVTVAQYAACVAASVCVEPSTSGNCDDGFSNWGVEGREEHPANCVNWEEASVFCAWVGARLPSEAEWEFSARSGGQDITYPWGEDEPTCEVAVMYEGTYGCGLGTYTMEVCSKPAGSTEQGLCDMAGNVWEWVRDWYHPSYDGAPDDGDAWEDPDGDSRAARGGSYYSGQYNLRAATRTHFNPLGQARYLGFRCARNGS